MMEGKARGRTKRRNDGDPQDQATLPWEGKPSWLINRRKTELFLVLHPRPFPCSSSAPSPAFSRTSSIRQVTHIMAPVRGAQPASMALPNTFAVGGRRRSSISLRKHSILPSPRDAKGQINLQPPFPALCFIYLIECFVFVVEIISEHSPSLARTTQELHLRTERDPDLIPNRPLPFTLSSRLQLRHRCLPNGPHAW